MEKIENVNLSDLLSEAENSIKKEKSLKTSNIIRIIFENIEFWTKGKKKAEQVVKQFEEKITNAYAGIERLKKDDWGYLDSVKPARDEKEEETRKKSNETPNDKSAI